MTPSTHPWPFFDLRLRIGDLELRLPTDDELIDLADLAASGIHAPGVMPFAVPWTDAPPDLLRRQFLQFHWRVRSEWSVERWSLELGVWQAGRLVGAQGIGADRFASERAVSTGSWLGAAFQGRGIGKAMRTAVLALAFDHLGAEIAESGAFRDNPASAGVSRALGYAEAGTDVRAPRGTPQEHVRYVLTADAWRSRPRPPVEVLNLEPCRPLLGAPVIDRAGGLNP